MLYAEKAHHRIITQTYKKQSTELIVVLCLWGVSVRQCREMRLLLARQSILVKEFRGKTNLIVPINRKSINRKILEIGFVF